MTIETCHSTDKQCKKCGKTKPLDQFYPKATSTDGREHSCKKCRRKQMSEADKKRYDKDKRRRKHLLDKYVMTPEVYFHLLLMQGMKCAICGCEGSGRSNSEGFVVDHCHATGRVRGLLCHPCNSAIGLLKENTQSMKNAISYLEENA